MSYFSPLRASNSIVLYLSNKQPYPVSVPFELQNNVSKDSWSTRIPAITRTGGKYSKPIFERIWFVLGLIASLAVPFGLYRLLRANLGDERHAEAGVISSAVMLGIFLVFIAPIALWKFLGQQEVNRMLNRWNSRDKLDFGQNAATWTVRTPGIFRDSTILTITLPRSASPTNFHPNAYLPSYVQGPTDPSANYFYPFKAEPGLPRMSTVGNVPLYDEKRALQV